MTSASGPPPTHVDTAKPPRRIVVAASLRNKDARFGDEPTPSSEARTDRKMPTFGTRLGPSHTFLGHPYTPTQAGKGDLVGSAATCVSRWSHDMRHVPSRRPHEYDYMADLGPGRYMGQKHPYDRKGATWYIGPGQGGRCSPRLDPNLYRPASGDTMVALPPAIGKQSLSTAHTEPSITFGRSGEESRTLARTLSKAQAESQATLRRSQKKLYDARPGTSSKLSPDELAQLQLLNRAIGVEEGGHTAGLYMPASSFGKTRLNLGASASFGSLTDRRIEPAAAPGPARTLSRSASWATVPEPPHGGKMGVAFRENPLTAPGPGSYEVGRHLSRSVLSHSRSTGSATLLSRVKMWKTDNYPGPASYFK
jgi:hypothetical protein